VTAVPIRLPQQAKPDVEAVNPLGKIPVLELDDGRLIADSPVIVAYLDELAGGGRLIPSGEDKWRALTLEALADGCMDAGFVLRMEQLKDEGSRDPAEVTAYTAKIRRTLDRIEQEPHWLAGSFNVGHLALACALDWIAFRGLLADPLAGRARLRDWLEALRERPSLASTRPSA
jgi:glutathione S-transferase